MPIRPDDTIRCSFCGRTQDQVRKMIAGSGNHNVFICDECIELCSEILEEELGKQEEEETEEEETSIEGMKILLVEDNDLNLEVAQYILEDAGAEIIVARNGLESVELFEQSESDSFDVILMDVMMPVMDGLTATKRIRKLKRKDARTVPVIAMTANVFNEDIIAAKEAGMNEHIAKPLDFDKLIHTLAKYFLKMDKKLIS